MGEVTDAEIIKELEYQIEYECGQYRDIDLPTLKEAVNLINRQQATINRLKAENKNCGAKIQNQREQLKACNEKIKRLEVDNEKLKRLEFQADALNEAYEESVREAVKEFAERLKECARTIDDDYSPNGELTFVEVEGIDNLLKEMG